MLPSFLRGIAAVFLFVAAGSAFARTARADGATLVVNETPVFTLRTAVGSTGAAERTVEIARRLSGLGGAVEWRLTAARRESTLKANGLLVLRVSEAEARAHGSAHAALARRWTAALRQAWSLPPFVLSTKQVRLATDGVATVNVRGSSARAATVENNNPDVVSVERGGTGLRLRALARGAARVTLRDGDRTATLDVDVWPYAAAFPQRLGAEVVGSPAPGSVVQRALETALNRNLATAPGASVRIVQAPVTAVGAGERRTVRWRVRVSAPNAIPAEGEVVADIANLGKRIWPEGALWYCNYPESVTRPQHLFHAPLVAGTPARMLYHHTNATSSPLVVKVMVANPTDRPARVVLLPGDGEPHPDPVRVGLEAGERFLRGWLAHAGEVVEVPAGTALPVAMRRLRPGETTSGLCSFLLLPGGPEQLSVTTDAVHPASQDARWLDRGQNATPWVAAGPRPLRAGELAARVDSDHIYPEPFRTLEARYEVGQRFLFLRVGEQPIASADALRGLQGNFGVAYTVRAQLVNPQPAPATVQVAFEASAGYSAALFVVDGQVRRAPLLMAKDEYLLKEVRLAPGESRTVSFLTIPLSGSSYPMTVIVRPRTTIAGVAP